MTVARFPTLAHWGAYTALVEDGRVVGCEPFARDPAPQWANVGKRATVMVSVVQFRAG